MLDRLLEEYKEDVLDWMSVHMDLFVFGGHRFNKRTRVAHPRNILGNIPRNISRNIPAKPAPESASKVAHDSANIPRKKPCETCPRTCI